MQQQKQKRGIQPEGCSSQRMREVRLALAEPFRRASFVYACLCGVLAAAQPPCMAAPGSRRAGAKCLLWVVPRGSDRCERTEAQRVLGKLKRDETQVAISKMQHEVPDTATELATAGQCLGWTAFSPTLSFLYQLLLSHLNGGAGGYRDPMPAPCPSSLPTSNIFSRLMVQPSFIFTLLFCSCCLYSWPHSSGGQKSTIALRVAGPYAGETGPWTHWGNHLYSFRSRGDKELLLNTGEGREAVAKGSPHLSGNTVDPKLCVWSTTLSFVHIKKFSLTIRGLHGCSLLYMLYYHFNWIQNCLLIAQLLWAACQARWSGPRERHQ